MTPTEFSKRNISILFVEDDPATLEMLSGLISARYPFVNMCTAKNGSEGLRHFKSYGADLILTDINLPVMNGLTMAREIRCLAPDVPFMVMTAHSRNEEYQELEQGGITHYIQKPIELKHFFTSLDNCIGTIVS